MKLHAGHEGEPLRQRGAVPRPGQPRADGVGHEGPAVGRRRGANYPERTPTSKIGDSCSSSKTPTATARPTSARTFLDDLNCPTGFQFYKDGVLVMQAPDLWFVRDTDGDGKADWKERVLMGMDSADSHHTTNSIVLRARRRGLPAATASSTARRSRRRRASSATTTRRSTASSRAPGSFETLHRLRLRQPARPRVRLLGQRPRHRRDRQQHLLRPARSAGGSTTRSKHRERAAVLGAPVAPVARAPGMLTSRHFPEEFQGNFLNLNVIGFQGIYRVKVRRGRRRPARREARRPDLVRRPELPPDRRQRRPGRRDLLRRLAQPDHRPHAAPPARPQPRPRARPDLPHHLRGPAADEAGEDRRPADRGAARAAEGAGEPDARAGEDRAGQARQRRGHRRGRRSGRRRSTRATRRTSTT